ncbi:zinc finger protein 40-like [Acanthaster planci]|uniref:Zinc finger protein 40-like n=1 Tax=Acanthaster planci TaxID=133434 RepID=A0A8B7ZJW5_ACAPL|nr:zinc finger protein 40-like [Acanthaster planci]
MPRQKQSKPKALKQQREEVEQLIRDGGTSDPKKQDSSVKSSRQSAVLSSAGKGKRRHRHKNAMKVKIVKRVRNKRITKALQAKASPVSENANASDRISCLNPNSNEKPVTELPEVDSQNVVTELGSEAASDSYVSDVDIFKDKYDMIKERSLKRATKVKQTVSDNDRAKGIEGSPKKGLESPNKAPVSSVKEPESHMQRSPTKFEASVEQISPKPRHSNLQRKSTERESGLFNRGSTLSYTKNIVKGRKRCVSEGMLTPQEALSKQQALEALLQITGVELHTMSKVPARLREETGPTMVTMTNSAPLASQTSLTDTNIGSMVKISESDKGVVKYQLLSDSLEEQGLKLVYTAPAIGQTNQEQMSYSAYRPRKNSTRSNASDSAEDPTAKDSQKCCKKPGRHVCQFCGRRCTKPSVLKKHIRSHTGERPYPCSPCGFSFKTKSNLYKHCKTHAHAIKAGLTPNSEDLAKLALPDLDEDDSEETESEDEITTCDATTCQMERTEKLSESIAPSHGGSTPRSETEPISKASQEERNTKPSNIPMLQVPRSLVAIPNIPQQQADSQSNQETVSRHSSWVPTQTSVLPTNTCNIKMDMPLLSTLLPTKSPKSTDIKLVDRPSSAPSVSAVTISKSNSSQKDRHVTSESRHDEEVVMSASGASSSQLLKSILPGELAGFRIDMETRRAIPVLNPQVGTPGAMPTANEASSNSGQLLIPLTGFNIVKSGGQYHVQIPVQGIPEDSLTMSLDGESGSVADDTNSSSSFTKSVSKESLQERIQLLISQNRAIVDNTVLESVKPRRTSASRRDSENNSPRVEMSVEPTNNVSAQEVRGVNPSGYHEVVNPQMRYRRNSLPEAQHSPSVSHGSMIAYPLPGEGNLLERVLKSQQQSTLKGTSVANKEIQLPTRDLPATKVDVPMQHTGNPRDNSNSIKDLLMQDRPHRLAQIAQHSPVQMPDDSPAGQGSPTMRFFPGSPWLLPQDGDSAMNQLRGTLQQHRATPHAHNLMCHSSCNVTEDVNVSQRISELRGTGRRRKYKSESDIIGDGIQAGPSSPKRRARKIKDIPSVVSPLATSSVQHQASSLTPSRTLTELQKGVGLKPVSPLGHFTSFPGHVSSLPYPLTSPSTHFTTYSTPLTPNSGYSTVHTSQTAGNTPGHMALVLNHMTPIQSHVPPIQSQVTTVRTPLIPVPSHMTSASGVLSLSSQTASVSSVLSPSSSHLMTHSPMQHYVGPLTSVSSLISSQPGQMMSSVVQSTCTYSLQGTPTHLPHQTAVHPSPVSSVYTQSQPVLSEVSVIQHTRMQGKSEPTNKELKLEVGQARDDAFTGYSWPYRYPVSTQSAGVPSPASQGLHLLAVASKTPDLPTYPLVGSQNQCFSLSERMQADKKNEQLISPLLNDPSRQCDKQKPSEETENAAPIAMQLLAAVAQSSSYAPRLSPRDFVSSKATSESKVIDQTQQDQPINSSPAAFQRDVEGTSVSNQEQLVQPVPSLPEMKQQREIISPKTVKVERNSASPKSPRCDARALRSDNSRQSPTTLPRVPASRHHLKLDLKSPLTSRMKSPGAADSQKSLLQIDPKSLLTPEALSIAESVMKLASPMKANTPITPVESARELGRLMAHAFHNAGGKVESLITSTQGTMMIGPIATPTPGSGSGSTQYFIIPSPSSSQPPSGFPGPNTLFSPSAVSTASSTLVSPLRSPLATSSITSQPQGHEAVVSTVASTPYKRVPPQKPDCQSSFDKQVLRQVKTNSALRQKMKFSKLSRSTARNFKITKTTFCCVKRPQPMYVQQGNNRKISMYSNWRPGGSCPNPLGISWKAHLALYDTSRNKKPRFYYVTTSISPPQGGIVTESAGWKPETVTKAVDSSTAEVQQRQAVSVCASKPSDIGSADKSMLELDALKAKEKKVKEISDHSEPNRIQIFSGGYKSNEDYVYVRGRGRGKYVCEECGIRCKKPSMLKKHIRTHTDMRPYQCQICNFAFKTKGNLTKHMKSKAHSKKCTKNGIPTADESCMEHQFSDADDEDTDSADGDTTDEEEDDEDDDDISETRSESAVPVSGIVPHRERYSSVPNIQDMPDSIDSQGRPLIWHQYHPGHSKKGQSETQDTRTRRDSLSSIPSSDSPKSGTAPKDEEKQPVKLSRSEVVGKLSRHLTNRHQQSLEKAQKASAAATGKFEDSKDQDSCTVFDISQLPPIHTSILLPQSVNPSNIIQPHGSKSDKQPPAPPVLDKYGHIVLTMSNSSASQYRLSTTIQDNLATRNKRGTSSGDIATHLSVPSPVQLSTTIDKQVTANVTPCHHSAEYFTSGSTFIQTQLHSPAASTESTSGTLSQKDHVSSFVRTPSSIPTVSISQADTNVPWAFTFPSHQEPPPIAKVPPGQSTLVVGVSPVHGISNREVFPNYAVSSDAQLVAGSSPRAYPTNFDLFPHLPRTVSPQFFHAFPDPSQPIASPSLNSSRPVLQSTSQTQRLFSPRSHPISVAPYPSSSEVTHSIPPPIFVEAVSDDEEEHSPRKRQKLDTEQNKIMVSGHVICGNASSSVPSWMSEPGSAIKQLLLARPSLIALPQESTKFPFSPFLPPSLASPKLSKSNSNLLSSSLQPPLVSPIVPSKMMQLPPTILSQVRSPTVQSSFSPRDEHQESPGPFVPPVARAKSQFQVVPPQSQMHCDRSPSVNQIPVEVAEELVSSPTHIGNHKCSSCSKIFMKPSQLRIHMRIHLEENAFSCPECMLSFPTRILLAKHERSEEHLSKVDAVELPSTSTESDPRPFKCKECQIAFRIPGHLAKHLRSRGHRMTLEREGKLSLPKEEQIGHEMSDVEQGDLVIDDSHQPSSPAGSSDKTDSASEGGDIDQLNSTST